jgi:hypothetical protein
VSFTGDDSKLFILLLYAPVVVNGEVFVDDVIPLSVLSTRGRKEDRGGVGAEICSLVSLSTSFSFKTSRTSFKEFDKFKTLVIDDKDESIRITIDIKNIYG